MNMSTLATELTGSALLLETARQQAEIEQLKAENAKLKANQPKPRALSCKVSEKGALSVYGMGRFPVTLYREQWEKLRAYMPTITQFIDENKATLLTKGVE